MLTLALNALPPPSPNLLSISVQSGFKAGNATASYYTLSMVDCLREAPFAAIQLCLYTTKDPVIPHYKPI